MNPFYEMNIAKQTQFRASAFYFRINGPMAGMKCYIMATSAAKDDEIKWGMRTSATCNSFEHVLERQEKE